ncbi:hypothetical protein CPJCM30710_08510 [Clostridium polyendosporum]|uniref:Cobalt-precorrin 5A hydrolase n=1 Tax=Clostridium polyendosporum TaxID=69208 RepID=A0A919VF92_9CLOT|nr:cobalt-precorrin 5A hydrolase [Clostridium polyendosporum]GIM28185.1 hypothetical protein CPJCM30710_08510 [Clostridium polyendosporum]
MKIACISFTGNGYLISEQIKNNLQHVVDIYTKDNYKDKLDNIFKSYDGIIFISATGIAVRLIAPYIIDKTIDPAVVVVDDLGRYSISLLSGHIGGANNLANEVAGAINAVSVITTASDGRGIDAVDVIAKRYDLYINSMKDAKVITALMVEGKRIAVQSEIDVKINYHNICKDNPDGFIVISSENSVSFDKPNCVLRPRVLNVGIGCRKGKTKEEILNAIKKVFNDSNLSIQSIKNIGTVDVKKDEKGLIEACKELKRDLKIFLRDEIEKVQHKFKSSSFVKSQIGVTSVAEPCAYLLGGEIIIRKTAVDGVTVSVAKEV